MTAQKTCFMDPGRPCDLTCKAAFEVDDPVDNVDCYLLWMGYHIGEAMGELKRVLEGFGGPSPGNGPPGGMPGFPGETPKKPKGFPNN